VIHYGVSQDWIPAFAGMTDHKLAINSPYDTIITVIPANAGIQSLRHAGPIAEDKAKPSRGDERHALVSSFAVS